MTTSLPISGLSGLITPARSTATSESARNLEHLSEAIRTHLLESYSMRIATENALTDLESLRVEASQDGWDGYGAKSLNTDAFRYAKVFLSALPTTAPHPEISADSDGDVALDWIFGQQKALTVSIGPNGRCTFAWMRGQHTSRGTDWIEDEIPASIVFALGQLARNAVAPK